MEQNKDTQNPTVTPAPAGSAAETPQAAAPAIAPDATPTATPTTSPTTTTPAEPSSEGSTKPKSNLMLLVIIGVAAIVIVGAIVGFLMLGKSAAPAPEETVVAPTEVPISPTEAVSPTPSATDINGVNNIDTGDPTQDVNGINQDVQQLQQ